MDAVVGFASRHRLLSALILVVAVLLCAILMPDMAMAALTGCVALVGLVTILRRPLVALRKPQRAPVALVLPLLTVMGTGPPLRVPLRT